MHSAPKSSEADSDAPECAVVLRARSGPGANCSSLGSAVDALFLGAVAVSALVAAAATALIAEQSRNSDAVREQTTTENEAETSE